MNVSGSINVGNVGFKLVVITGTLPANGSDSTAAYPTGVTPLNVIMSYGICVMSNYSIPWTYNLPADTSWPVSHYFDTNYIRIRVPSGATAASGRTYNLCIVYVP